MPRGSSSASCTASWSARREPPPPDLIDPLAEQFAQGLRLRQAGRDDAAVEPVLLAGTPTGPRIKPPVEFVARHRPRAGRHDGHADRAGPDGALETLGQNVFHPPSVKGWDGGQTWLNGQTLLFRQNLALALTSPAGRLSASRATGLRPGRSARQEDRRGRVDFFLELFLQGDVPDETRKRVLDYAARARGEQKLPVVLDGRGRRRTTASAPVPPGDDAAGVSS